MQIRIYLFFFIFLIISGCSPKTKLSCLQQLPELKQLQENSIAYLDVDGIECSFCAYTVINGLKKMEGIIQVDYELNDGKYENGRIKLVYNKEMSLKEEEINKVLEEEGFKLKNFVVTEELS